MAMKSSMKATTLLASAMMVLGAAAPPAPSPSPGQIVEAAAASEWVTIAPADMLVMDLSPDTASNARRVVIQLMPPPFSQGWTGNIRKLTAAHWWDGTSVNRVQDNYVVQWGDATEKKALPGGLAKMAQSEYESAPVALSATTPDIYVAGNDGGVGFQSGWPFAFAESGRTKPGQKPTGTQWPIHCYGMVGVGRDMPPDTGSGAELYTVIGHAPRQLDRNIALVGRVISGLENLSSLPRGTGPLGFYEKPEQRVTITSVRLASELPEADRPRFQYLSTESATFAKYADARANRHDPFFIHPAGGADICNVPVPIRKTP
jgi:cyclophilin family peptidyl-prolyl cis-trans isomerase